MNNRGTRDGLAIWLMALTWLSPGTAVAVEEAAREPQSRGQDQQLGEVLVEGRRTREKPPTFEEYQQTFDFLARLVGDFYVEGSVDLHAQGREEDLRKVSGRTECVGFGVGPGVHCELRIRWPGTTGPNNEEIPGGLSTLNPAVMLFGLESAAIRRPDGYLEPRRQEDDTELQLPGIFYILIDSKGVPQRAMGELITPDMLRSRSKCAAMMRGDCEQVTLITAPPDLKTVEISTDLVIDGEETVSYFFVLNRLPGSESVVYGRKDKEAR